MSEQIRRQLETGRQVPELGYFHPMPVDGVGSDEDFIDTGAAVLAFYSTLVDLLGRCAPGLPSEPVVASEHSGAYDACRDLPFSL